MLAFAASGWGTAMAAALCPHANLNAAKSAAEKRAVKSRPASKPHCHDSAMEQDAGAQMEMPPSVPGSKASYASLGLQDETPCTHCMGQNEIPVSTVLAVQKAEQKRSLESPVTQAILQATPALTLARPVIYRQGAPPGPSTPKHLLISLLLI